MPAVGEPVGLLRDVGVPDQEVLREADVRPEDREPEHELAEVMEVLLGDDAEIARATQQREDHGHEAEHGQRRPREDVDPEDGGEPVGVQRHQEVEGTEGETQREGGQGRRREVASAYADVEDLLAVLDRVELVLCGRPAPEHDREGAEEEIEDDRPVLEAALVEVGALAVDHLVLLDGTTLEARDGLALHPGALVHGPVVVDLLVVRRHLVAVLVLVLLALASASSPQTSGSVVS